MTNQKHDLPTRLMRQQVEIKILLQAAIQGKGANLNALCFKPSNEQIMVREAVTAKAGSQQPKYKTVTEEFLAKEVTIRYQILGYL